MSIPTTAKFQIAVSSTDENGGAEKLYTLTLSLQALELPQIGDGFSMQPLGDVPLPKDPPGFVMSLEPMGDVPLPKDPPKATCQITLGEEQVYTLELSVEGDSDSDEIQVTPLGDEPPASQEDCELRMKAA